MAPEIETREAACSAGAEQGLAVECVVFDRADRPKRRHLLPLAVLLAPLGTVISAGSRDAN